jgi:hypothetical protein
MVRAGIDSKSFFVWDGPGACEFQWVEVRHARCELLHLLVGLVNRTSRARRKCLVLRHCGHYSWCHSAKGVDLRMGLDLIFKQYRARGLAAAVL